ncbi:hypothetical protein [Flavobacterium laiguense]|uniref:Uncharacterized protein n=1 Tax=Flavobacterium laiguense TaxID=2169409 RepID=A0A2U1JX36_9FLAO|nr:hypothetical protein [Flavobacterium laiguense]PWA09519.1 hypothetical protein DB891_07500 [Flavobacterium laiguense]
MKTKEKVINLIIPNGSKEATLLTALEYGYILGAEVHTNHTDIENMAEFAINDDSGIAIAKSSHINHWKRREGAGFHDSYKPLQFETNAKTFNFIAKTKTAVAKDTYFNAVLIYSVTEIKCSSPIQ